jgi:hypothetical protein
MSNDQGFVCSCCGERHGTLPLSYGSYAADYWSPDQEDNPASELASDQCVIDGEHFFELEPTDHPLAVEQRTGITRARVQQFTELLLHPGT